MWPPLLILSRVVAAMARKQKPSFYAVAKGRHVGVFRTWAECEAQVSGASGARYKGFNTLEGAIHFIRQFNVHYTYQPLESSGSNSQAVGAEEKTGKEGVENGEASSPWWERPSPERDNGTPEHTLTTSNGLKRGAPDDGREEKSVGEQKKAAKVKRAELEVKKSGCCTEVGVVQQGKVRTIEVYTDGASSSNGRATAAAGWGVYWPESKDPTSDQVNLNESRRLPGPLQTNNRAELMAIIRAVQLCPDPHAQLVIYTDSQYCIKAINEWQRNWRKNKWLTSKKEPVLNKDLIRLLERELRARSLRPTLVHVKGHSTSLGNQEADRLAVEGASQPAVPPDLWREVEPSDSEDESPALAHQRAIESWQKSGFTFEQATKRAGTKSA